MLPDSPYRIVVESTPTTIAFGSVDSNGFDGAPVGAAALLLLAGAALVLRRRRSVA